MLGIDIGIGDAVTKGLEIIEKFIPDPKAKADAIFRLKELEQKGDLAELNSHVSLLLGQVEINKIEAASTNIFKSGWRPFIGWVCGSGLAYQLLFRPIVGWTTELIAWAYGSSMIDFPFPPSLDMGTLITLTTGLLGLGTMRTYERLNNKIPKGQ